MLKISKIIKIIPKHRVRQIPILIILLIFGAAFEVVGIGLVIPLMGIITGDTTNVVTRVMISYFTKISAENLVLLSVIIFSLTYVLKALFLSFLAWLNGRFSFATKAEVSNLLMKKYLGAPFEFHQKKNSAELIRNLTAEANQLASNVLNPLLVIASESIVIISISAFLIVLEPIGTISVVLTMVLFSILFQKVFGKYTSELGLARQNADGMLIKKSQEALGGIKDVKVLGKTQFFYEQFRYHNLITASVSARHYLLKQLPRMYLETLGVLVLSVLIVMLTLRGDTSIQTISALTVFAMAAFRLLPSANRILSSLTSLRYADPTVDLLHAQLKTFPKDYFQMKNNWNDDLDLKFDKNIELKSLTYHYPNASINALSNITFSINKGESIGIIGKSGAGKSTLSDIILGLLTPSSGKVLVDHVDINENIRAWQHKIGYVQQDIFLLDDSIRQNITFGLREDEVDEKKLSEVIFEAALDEFVSSLPDGLNTHLGERGVRLSGGQKQRIGIARALYRNPPILIFDEATSALDNATESEIVSAIQRLKGKRTIIVIAHRLSTIGHCDRVIELTDGRISRSRSKKEEDKVY